MSNLPQPECYLQPIDLTLPHEGLPLLYEAFNHPLGPPKPGRAIVFHQDLLKKGMDEIFEVEEQLTVPLGTPEEVEEMGKLINTLIDVSYTEEVYRVSAPPRRRLPNLERGSSLINWQGRRAHGMGLWKVSSTISCQAD